MIQDDILSIFIIVMSVQVNTDSFCDMMGVSLCLSLGLIWKMKIMQPKSTSGHLALWSILKRWKVSVESQMHKK